MTNYLQKKTMLGTQSTDDTDSPALTPVSSYCTIRK